MKSFRFLFAIALLITSSAYAQRTSFMPEARKPVVPRIATPLPTPTPTPVLIVTDGKSVSASPQLLTVNNSSSAVSPDSDEFYALCRLHVLRNEAYADIFSFSGDKVASTIFRQRADAIRTLYLAATGQRLP